MLYIFSSLLPFLVQNILPGMSEAVFCVILKCISVDETNKSRENIV